MKRFFLVFLLVGAISMLQAQKLQKTALEISDLKKATFTASDGTLHCFGSDENNYYVYYDIRTMSQTATDVKYVAMGKSKDSYFVINKKLSTVKRFFVLENMHDRFLTITLNGNNVLILVAREQKSEQTTQIIKQTYAKATGKLLKETVIATFPKSKTERWMFYSAVSPDETKTGILLMIATKKSMVDSYFAAVLDEAYNVEWRLENELDLSNESFSVNDVALTNESELYVAFMSYPKTTAKKSYIDLVYLTENAKEKMDIPLEKHHFAKVQMKPLKNGDVYLTGLLSPNNKSLENAFFSMKINGKNFNDEGIHIKDISVKGYSLDIESILELDNGNIAVVCEQGFITAIRSQNITSYRQTRGSVTTFFVNGNDASIEDVSTMNKIQKTASLYNVDAKIVGGSIFPFVYGNKVAYLFNDNFKKHTNPAKYSEKKGFEQDAKGKTACIVLSTQESGEKAKLNVLTGKQEAAGRFFRQILFEEDGKLIVLTRNNKTAYIETLTLP